MPVLTPTIWIILIAAALQAATGLGWFVTSARLDRAKADGMECRSEHRAFVDQTKLAGQRAADKAAKIELEQKRNADETAGEWAAALDRVRGDADRRVRLAAARNPGGRGVSATAQTGLTAPTADANPIPPPERVAADCAETTLTANFLQQYVERLQQ